VFLDMHGIGAGARWKEALAKANEPAKPSSSRHSLTSNECYVEPGSTLRGVGARCRRRKRQAATPSRKRPRKIPHRMTPAFMARLKREHSRKPAF
jgi:hypothetical protein